MVDVEREDRELPTAVAGAWPFPPRFTDVGDGVRVHHAEVGAGDPVVLVHGNPTWGFLWRKFLPALADAGYRALAPDLAGLGRSDKPVDAAYHTVNRHVANFTAWAEALDLRDVTLVVHDWGGPIGLGWAGAHADRVKRVVITNTVVFAPRRERRKSTFHAAAASPAGPLLGRRLNLLVEAALRFGVARRLDAVARRGYLWPLDAPRRRAAPLALARMVPDGPDHPSARAIRRVEDGLKNLAEKPAIVLWGDADPVFPKRFAEKWPPALPGVREIKRYAHAAHFLQEDVPDAMVRDLIAFLGREGARDRRPPPRSPGLREAERAEGAGRVPEAP